MTKNIPKFLKFRQSFTIATLSPSKIQIRNGEVEVFQIKGESVSYILPSIVMLLDGTRPWTFLIDHFKGRVPSQDVKNYVTQLYDAGLLVEEKSDTINENVYNFDYDYIKNMSSNYMEILEKIFETNVGIISNSKLFFPLVKSMNQYGFRKYGLFRMDKDDEDLESIRECKIESQLLDFDSLSNQISNIDVLISILPSTEASSMDKLNEVSLSYNIPWLPVDILSGPYCSMGPLVIRHMGPCYECFRSRLRSNMGNIAKAYDEFIEFQRYSQISVNPWTPMPVSIQMVTSLISLEIFKLVSEVHIPSTFNNNVVVDFMNMDIRKDKVLKVPRCSACSFASNVAKGHWEV